MGEDGKVVIGCELETKEFDAQIQQLTAKLEDMESDLATTDLSPDSSEYKQLQAEIEKTKNKIIGLNKQKEKFNQEKFDISSLSEGMSNIVSKAKKWALAIFGVRSAYMGIRQAMGILSEYNEDMANDIANIKYSIASSLEKPIRAIIDLVYKLLQYINYLTTEWFGFSLFADKSAKSMKSSSKSAKEIKKSLAGFDEMNILGDNTKDTGAGGYTPQGIKPLEKGEIPEWLKWIKDHGIEVAGIIGGITTALTLLKLGIDPLMSAGIGLVIAGIGVAIQGVVDFIKDPSWENFKTILEGIVIILVGVAAITGSWIPLVIALVVGLVAAIIENWDTIKAVLLKVGGFLWDYVLNPIIKFFKATFDTIWSIIKLCWSLIKGIFVTLIEILKAPFVAWWETVKGVISSVKGVFTNLIDGIKKLFSGDLKGALNSFKNVFANIFNGLWSIVKYPLNLIIGGVNALIKGLNKISFEVPDWVPGIGGKKLGFNIREIPKLAKGGIVNMPSSGVPIGGAIAGERGAEGVIPLTDSQQMALLGEAIGKYITINANITNTMNGRVISRELQKIKSDSDFAFNR